MGQSLSCSGKGACSGCPRSSASAEKAKEFQNSATRLKTEEYDPVNFAPNFGETLEDSNGAPPKAQRNPLSPRQQNKAPGVPLPPPETTSQQERTWGEQRFSERFLNKEEKESPFLQDALHEANWPDEAPKKVAEQPHVEEVPEVPTIKENEPLIGAEAKISSPKTSPRTSPRLDSGTNSSSMREAGTSSQNNTKRKSWFNRRKSKQQDDSGGEGVGSARASSMKRRSIMDRLRPSTSSAGGARENKEWKSGNKNIPLDYMWLSDTLWSVTKCQAHTLGCVDLSNNTAYTPLFFCIGGCPNSFCGMQVIMYCVNAKKQIDFWWVKPVKGKGNEIEKQTLNRHGKGTHKNDPGRSKGFYKPLGDLFGEAQSQGGQTFGIEMFNTQTNGTSAKSARAYLEDTKGNKQRKYLSIIWQEEWTSNPLAWSKYIKGKMIYQKDLNSQVFTAIDYSITDGKLTMATKEDQSFKDVLPGTWVKDLSL